MKKIITISFICVIALGAIYNCTLTQIENNSLLSLASIENIAYTEIITIPAKKKKDNPKSCNTTKLVKVELSDGTFKWESFSVTGMENECKNDEDSTCTSYACYAQD